LGEAGGIDFGGGGAADNLAAAEHGVAVREGEDFAEFVGDEDDGAAFGGKATE